MKIIGIQGNAALMDREKTLFLCSKRTPYECYGEVFRWVEGLTDRDCVMCFNSTEMEEEVMKSLLVHRIPTILIVMSRFRDENNVQIRKALDENRMLIVTLRRDEPAGKGATPRLRNQFVMEMAQHIVCGYINKNGSIFPILAGEKDVTFLLDDRLPRATEQEVKPYRWTVAEDKTLLRMYYADMGIHEIHKNIGRPYSTIRQRLNTITLPDDVLKGREFEDYVLSLFDIPNNATITLKEWRGDKTLGDVCPENNHHPDFVFQHQQGGMVTNFAVECKWRNSIPRDIGQNLFPTDKTDVYQRFSTERHIPVFILLGIGGEPCEPESLYIVPLEHIPSVVAKESPLSKFQRKSTASSFSIDEFIPVSRNKAEGNKAKAYSMADIRLRYPNAYRPWTEDDDALLLQLCREGKTTRELSIHFGRQPRAIRSRIKKISRS